MAKKPNTNRSEAFEKLVKAAGGKLVAMYATMTAGLVRWRSLMPIPLWRHQWVQS